MLELTLRKIKSILDTPARMVVTTYRAGLAALHDQYGIPKEQAATLIQAMLDDVFKEVNTSIDVYEEHPDWSEEMLDAETKRRLKK